MTAEHEQARWQPHIARHRLVTACGAAAILVGVLVLIGWVADIAVLKSVRPGLANMKVNAALLFVLSGVALLAANRVSASGPVRRATGLVSAMTVVGIASLTLMQYSLARDLGIDQLLVREPIDAPFVKYPGRMAPVTALMFILLGAALGPLQARRAPRTTQALAVLGSLVATLCCLSYLYGASSAQHIALFAPVAVPTPLLMLALGAGVLAASPDVWLVRLARSAGVGGVMVRQLLPAVIVLPIVVGWLRLEGQRAGWYDTEFGLAIYALSNIVLIASLVLWTAMQAQRAEGQRLSIDASYHESEERYRLLIDSLPSMTWAMRPDLTLEFLNPRSSEFTGLTVAQANARGWGNLVHPDDVSAMRAAVADPIERGVAHEAEYRFLHHTGEYRWVVSRAVPLRDASGTLVKWVGSTFDVHDQKLAEDRLRKSERRYRALVQASQQIVWSIGGEEAEGLPWWNALTGQTMEQSAGWGWLDAVHPDDRVRVRATWEHAFATLTMYTTEYRIRIHGGDYRHFAVDGVALCDANGQLEEWIGTLFDITDRKVAETGLRESEARFRLLLDGVPQIVWTCLPDGRCDYLSRQWDEYTGVAEADHLGYAWLAAVHPDDRKGLAAHWRHAIGTSSMIETEVRLRSAKGEYRWFKSRAVLFEHEDGVRKWFGTSTDVHDEKVIESQLLALNASLEARVAERTAALATNEALIRQFVKYSPAAIAMFDAKLCYVQLSDRWLIDYQLAGRDVIGKSHYDVFPEIPEAWKVIHRRVLAGAVERCDEDAFPRADGTTDWLQWECRPWYKAEGEIGGLIMFTQVITARKVIEEQVKASLREKEVLLKEIHHRVKNNLQIVSTLLDLQSDHTQDAKALEMFKESRGRVKSMALIHERLYRAKDVARVDFAEYVRQLAADLYMAYKASDDVVTLDVDVDIPPLAIDIAIPCGLLLNELMSNCFKHAFAQDAVGRIHVGLHRDDDGMNVLVVSDTGPGFPAHTDFRNTTSFGLQLVSTLVDQLNGEISLISNGGSTFTVRFPTPPTSLAPGSLA